MPLHPQAQMFLDALAAQGAPALEEIPPQESRLAFAALTELFGEPPEVDSVVDRVLAGHVPTRIYSPHSTELLPAVLYFHGGGWVLGDLNTHDTLCRRLTNASGCVVISVDYRRPPEHVFPAAIDDCFGVLKDVAKQAESLGINPKKLAVAGDSAGGNLAAATTLKSRELGGPEIHSQWLVYPVIEPNFESASYQEFAVGYGLTKSDMIWFWKQYLGDQFENPNFLAAPLLCDSLEGLPPANIIIAEYDVLRDEGEYYAARLREAGVSVALSRFAGLIHGFMHFTGAFDDGLQAVLDLGTDMKKQLRE